MVVAGILLHIDDFSRKVWVYFFKQKSDASNTLKNFKTFVERQNSYHIKILRTDRGQEYLVCDDFLEKNGIQHQLTTKYIPQQNVVTKGRI